MIGKLLYNNINHSMENLEIILKEIFTVEIKLGDLIVTKSKKISGEVAFDTKWGVYLDLIFLPKPELNSIVGKFTKMVTNPKTRQMEQEPDTEKIHDHIMKNYILGWRGVTYEWLATQIPLDLSLVENPKTEIPFNAENLKLVSDNLYNFDGWILDAVKEASNFKVEKKEEKKEAETKN